MTDAENYNLSPYDGRPLPCPACRYIRKINDLSPKWECPQCHVAYIKVNSSSGETQQINAHTSSKKNTQRPIAAHNSLKFWHVLTALILLIGTGLAWRHYTKVDISRLAESADGIAASQRVVVFGTENCGYCRATKAYLDSKQIPYTYLGIDTDQEAAAKFHALGGRGVPLIFVGEERMDGFSQSHLQDLLYKAGYD